MTLLFMPQEPQTFLELALGGMTLGQWGFNIMLMCMGIFLYIRRRVIKRKDKAKNLSWIFYLTRTKNIFSLVTSFILTYLSIRFYSEYQDTILTFLPPSMKMTPYFAMVFVGFGQHWISEWINKKTISKPK